MNQILQGKSMTIFGVGTQTRAFTYIGDAAPLIAKSVNEPEALGQVFNVGADIPYIMKELAVEVAAAMGVKPQILHLNARNEVKHAWCNHSKVARVFSQAPVWDLRSGVLRMAACVRRVGPRKMSRFANIEVRRNLPTVWED